MSGTPAEGFFTCDDCGRVNVEINSGRVERFRRDLKKAGVIYRDAQERVADFHALRKTFGTNSAKAGVASRVAMSLMRHSDRRLTDKIYTDENLLGTWSAIDALPNYDREASQGASQKLGTGGQNASEVGTTSNAMRDEESPANTGQSHIVAFSVTGCQKEETGGSDGARTQHKSNAGLTETEARSQAASQQPGSTGHDEATAGTKAELQEVVDGWAKLSRQLRDAMLAIVRSIRGKQ